LVADALAINCNTLRAWRDRGVKPVRIPTPSEKTVVTETSEESFIELTPPSPSVDTVELLLPTGILLKVTPMTPPSYVARLISALRCVER